MGTGIRSAGKGKAQDGDANSGECRTSRRARRKPRFDFRGDVVHGDKVGGAAAGTVGSFHERVAAGLFGIDEAG